MRADFALLGFCARDPPSQSGLASSSSSLESPGSGRPPPPPPARYSAIALRYTRNGQLFIIITIVKKSLRERTPKQLGL